MERNAAWISLDGGRIEHVRVSTNAAGFSAKGLIARRGEHALSSLQYRIEGDASWRLRRIIVHALRHDFATLVGSDPTNPASWRFLENGPDHAQMLYGEPLTAEQIRKLSDSW